MERDETAVHISRLRLLAKSAQHYEYGYGGDATYAMERGEAVHALVFETRQVLAWQGKVRAGKEYDAYVADNPDALILTKNEGGKALAMAEAVRRCPGAMKVLDGEREKTRRWKVGGRDCEGTPDVAGHGFVTELKTLPSADPFRAQWHGRKLGYHAQLAWYQDGLALADGEIAELAYVVAVEATAPFPVTVLRLTPRALDEGRRMYRTWWERLMVCEAANEWPGYVQTVVDFDVPDDEQELDFSGVEEAA